MYNFDNAVVQEALSNQFSIPTSKEYICKKCDKHLLVEKNANKYVTSATMQFSESPLLHVLHVTKQ